MEIGDVPAALRKVRSFIVILERGRDNWTKRGDSPRIWDQRNKEILERLPLVLQIAARADPELPAKLQADSYYSAPGHHGCSVLRQVHFRLLALARWSARS